MENNYVDLKEFKEGKMLITNNTNASKMLELFAKEVVENIGVEWLEAYLWVDGDGEWDMGVRQTGHFGEVDNSFIFFTMELNKRYWDDEIVDWFDSWETFEDLNEEDETYLSFIDVVCDAINSIFDFEPTLGGALAKLELLECKTIDELGKMLLDYHGFDIWDLDYEQLILHDNCFVVDEKYLIDVEILEWTEGIDDTVIEVLEISEI